MDEQHRKPVKSPDQIPMRFWAEWYSLYEQGEVEKMEALLAKTSVCKLSAVPNGAASILNDLLVDLMEYLEANGER